MRVTIHPREAAALDRLLDAYLATDEGDPGRDALASFKRRLERLAQDHADYESAQRPEGGEGRG